MKKVNLLLIAVEDNLDEVICKMEFERGLVRDYSTEPVKVESEEFRMGSEDLSVYGVSFFYNPDFREIQLRVDGMYVIGIEL